MTKLSGNMRKALNHAVQLATNRSLDDIRTARMRQGLLGGGPGLDTKRPAAWCEFGWPTDLDFQMRLGLYQRHGIAHGVVDKLVGACWRTNPWVIEGDEDENDEAETPWEKAVGLLFKRTRLWRQFAEADRRRLVGVYSGLLIHVADNKQWSEPVSGKANVVKFTPAWAGELKPLDYDNDTQSEFFGQPIKWTYTEAPRNGAQTAQREVHRDRVFILGDWASTAAGFYDPVFNNFVNLEKVEGGSGESFLKNAARQLNVNFDSDVNLQQLASVYGVEVDKLTDLFNEAAAEVNRGNDTLLVTQGAQTTQLVSPVSDPTPTYDINVQSVAAGLDFPTKIIIGMQTGERASTEDQKYMNARCQSRRNGDLTFDAENFMSHLMRIRVIETKEEFAIMWDDLTESTQGERLDNAAKMAKINADLLASGQPAFDVEEIREAAGYDSDLPEPLPEVEPEEGLDDGGNADPTE